MATLNKNKANGIVQSGKKAFHKQRQTQVRDDEFDSGGSSRKQTAAGGGLPHAPILSAAGGDVVLARSAGVVDNPGCQEPQVCAYQLQQAPVVEPVVNHQA